jgi:hypothetical protein
MTLAEFIQELSERVQIDAADEQLKALVMNPALSNVQIPSNVAASVQQRLMTENEAKINPVVKKHFTGTALSTVDSKIKDLLDEFGFDDETKSGILTEQSTYNRIPMLAKAIADAKDRSISATGGEKKTLIDKINELQNLLNAEKEGRKSDIFNVNSQWESKLTEKELYAMFSQYNYALDLDKDVTISTAKGLWEKKLKERGGKYVFTNDGLKLVNAEAPDLPFTIDNKTVDVKSFTENVLAEAKLLKVQGQAPASPAGTPTPAPVQVVKQSAPAAKAATSKALADFRAGSNPL